MSQVSFSSLSIQHWGNKQVLLALHQPGKLWKDWKSKGDSTKGQFFSTRIKKNIEFGERKKTRRSKGGEWRKAKEEKKKGKERSQLCHCVVLVTSLNTEIFIYRKDWKRVQKVEQECLQLAQRLLFTSHYSLPPKTMCLC